MYVYSFYSIPFLCFRVRRSWDLFIRELWIITFLTYFSVWDYCTLQSFLLHLSLYYASCFCLAFYVFILISAVLICFMSFNLSFIYIVLLGPLSTRLSVVYYWLVVVLSRHLQFGCSLVLLLTFVLFFQGDADSGLDRLWQKKKVEVKQQWKEMMLFFSFVSSLDSGSVL